VDLVHGSWTSAGHSPRWTDHHGGGTTGRGVHGESISGLTGSLAAARWPGDGGEETVEEALDAGGAWAWREEKESGERCGGERWSSPFI
jgi:hypothetical protein